MRIKDAFQKALDRLKKKAGISPIAIQAEKEIKEIKIPLYPAVDNEPRWEVDISDTVMARDLQRILEEVDRSSEVDRCLDCDLKKKQIQKEKTKDAIKKVFEDLNALTKEEFQDEIDQYKEKPECDPKTCWGECQGKGWCHIAQEWQERIHIWNTPPTVKYIMSKKQKKLKRKQYKNKKVKWQNIHNNRKRRM